MPRACKRDGLKQFPKGATVKERLQSEVGVRLTKNLEWPKKRADVFGSEKTLAKEEKWLWRDTEPYETEGHTTEGQLFLEETWTHEGTLLRVKRKEIEPWAPKKRKGQPNLVVRYLGQQELWHRLAAFHGGSRRVNCPKNMTWPQFQKRLPSKPGQKRKLHLYHVAHGAEGHKVSLVEKMTIKKAGEHLADPRPRNRGT